MRFRRIAASFALSTLVYTGLAQSTQGVGDRRGANGGADQGSVRTTPERQVHRDDTTTRHHTQVYGPANQGGRRYDGSSNGLQGKRVRRGRGGRHRDLQERNKSRPEPRQ